MPHRQKHRGVHPTDETLFSEKMQARLREAVEDLSWLLTRNYPEKAALKLVGDKYKLKVRQRNAVLRCACSDCGKTARENNRIDPLCLAGSDIFIDGFNLLITMECALSGGIILSCRDGCYRDIASVHGTYRTVEETVQALKVIGEGVNALGISRGVWLLDKPVSNSGRLKSLIEDMAQEHGWNWEARLVNNPDKVMLVAGEIVATSDSMVLDKVGRWTCLARYLVDYYVPGANVLRLG